MRSQWVPDPFPSARAKKGLSTATTMDEWYEPNSRYHHVAGSVGRQVVVWGGQTSEFYSNDGRIKLATIIEQLDPYSEVWCQRSTGGTPHPGLSSAACTSFGNHLFMYGGTHDSTAATAIGVLTSLNLTTLIWSLLCPETAGGPMRKYGCGIVHFNNGKLAVIGGYGYPTEPGSFIRNYLMGEDGAMSFMSLTSVKVVIVKFIECAHIDV